MGIPDNCLFSDFFFKWGGGVFCYYEKKIVYLEKYDFKIENIIKIKREYVKKNTLNLKPKFFISRLYKVSPSKAFLP